MVQKPNGAKHTTYQFPNTSLGYTENKDNRADFSKKTCFCMFLPREKILKLLRAQERLKTNK